MNSSIELVFTLVIIFQLKHFIADFPLQSSYMLMKQRADWSFFTPLLVHSLVHAAMTLVIVLWFAPSLWWLSLVDLTVHFILDRIKAGPKYLGRFNDIHKKSFWFFFGLDQMLHHLTHLYFIWMIVKHSLGASA